MKQNVTALRVNSSVYTDSKKADLAGALVSMYSNIMSIKDEQNGITGRINHYCFVEIDNQIKTIRELTRLINFLDMPFLNIWEYVEIVTIDKAE